MPLTLSDVAHLADLARIAQEDEDAQSALASLNRLFTLIEKIHSVRTEGALSPAHPVELAGGMRPGMSRLREDKANAIVPRETCQNIACATESDLYLVPKVIE